MKFLYFLAGVIFFLAALLWTLPPQKALVWWGGDLQADVQLYAPQGGAGRGSAKTLTVDSLRLDNLQWRLRFISLLKLRLGYVIRAEIDGQPGTAVAEFGLGGNLHLHDVQASMKIESLLPVVSGLSLPVDGQLYADMDYLHARNNRLLEAEGQLQLDRAVWRAMRPALPLGSATLQVTTEDDVISGQLLSGDGSPAEAQGGVTLDQKGGYQVDIRLKPGPNADQRLGNLMKGLGRSDAQGWHKVKTQGRL